MRLAPITLKAANAYVREHHRHNGPTQGGLFAVSVRDESGVCGVARTVRCSTSADATSCGRMEGDGGDE